MKKVAIIGGLLLIIVFLGMSINKNIRNDRYEKVGALKVYFENDDDRIEPKVYKSGFDFNYDVLPVIEVGGENNSLIFELDDTNVDEIIVGEDYYRGNTCYKDTYNLKKNDNGKFELPAKTSNIKGKHATYYVKYNLNDKGVFVFKANFI